MEMSKVWWKCQRWW